MYRLEVRLYQLVDRIRTHAELYCDEPDESQQVWMTAHIDTPWSSPAPPSHLSILAMVHEVCDEIAQNFDESLF